MTEENLDITRFIGMGPIALAKGNSFVKGKWSGPVSGTSTYWCPVRGKKNGKNDPYKFVACRGYICSTTKPEKQFIRVAIPYETHQAVLATLPEAMRELTIQPSVSNDEWVDMVVPLQKWNCTLGNVPAIRVQYSKEGHSETIELSQATSAAMHALPRAHIECSLTVRFSFTIKSDCCVDTDESAQRVGAKIRMSMYVESCSMITRREFTMYDSTYSQPKVDEPKCICDDPWMLEHLRSEGIIPNIHAESTISDDQSEKALPAPLAEMQPPEKVSTEKVSTDKVSAEKPAEKPAEKTPTEKTPAEWKAGKKKAGP